MPKGPRGHVRDIRLRWALEEAGLDYAVRTVPVKDRGPDHQARQPFAQVPFLGQRFDRLEAVMQARHWLAADRFTVADLLMADVLRVPSVLDALQNWPAVAAYVARVCARPAFQKAYGDQMAHFAAADAARSPTRGAGAKHLVRSRTLT